MASWIHSLPGRDRRLLSLLTAVAMIILPASFNACSDSGTEPDIIDVQHIRETTLRFMTELHWDSHCAFVTFASAEGTPRDSSLGEFSPLPAASYQRLDDITHPMRPFEECTLHLGGVSHPDFEQRGVCIWAGDVTRIGANEVVVYGGYYVGGLGAAGYLVRLERNQGIWEVVDFDMLWIS